MDKNNLFQNMYSWGCGYTYNQYTEKCANRITQTGVSDSYFLGYVSPEDLPSTTFPTKVYFDDDNDIITFESASKNNAMIGYCRYTGYDYSGFAFKQSNGVNAYTYNLNEYWYLNNFYPEFSSTCENLRLQFWYILYDGGAVYQTFSYISFNISGYSSINAFLKGYLNVGLNIQNKNYIVNYDALVAGNGTLYLEASDGSGWGARIFLAQIWFAGGSSYNGSYTSSGGYPCHIKTFGDFDDGTSGYLYRFGQCFGVSELGRYCAFATGRNGQTPRRLYKNETYERGAGLFETVQIHEDELPYDRDTFTYSDGVITRCTVTDGFYEFYLYITNPSSIKTAFDLAYRVNPGHVASYAEGLSYATDVSGDNFLVNLKTGDINNPAFKSGLMPWQYIDTESGVPVEEQGAISNEFTVDDLPPYEPTPPTPTDDEGHNPDNPVLSLATTEDNPLDLIEEDESRDTPVDFPISAFMTQYIMDAQDIWDLGVTLWSGIGDPNSNVFKNFLALYGSNGTFNFATVMDFFVSVKAFPFNLNDANYTHPVSAMTVGTGAVPLLNRQMTVFTASTYLLDCGTVSTNFNAYQLGSSYDYRNYVNCEISCFLPYCGTIELNPSDVFPYTLHCKYFIDMISGSCTACVYVLRAGQELLVGSKNGQIGKIVPLTASNLMGVVGAALSDVTSIAQTIGQTILNAAEKKALGSSQMPVNEASKNSDYLKQLASYKENQQRISDGYGSMRSAYNATGSAAQGISNVMTRSGVSAPSLSPGTGLEALMISRRPYITIRRLKYASPNTYGHTTGFYSTDGSSDKTISSYSGFTQFENVDLTGIYATREELDEIKALLETGVYL